VKYIDCRLGEKLLSRSMSICSKIIAENLLVTEMTDCSPNCQLSPLNSVPRGTESLIAFCCQIIPNYMTEFCDDDQ